MSTSRQRRGNLIPRCHPGQEHGRVTHQQRQRPLGADVFSEGRNAPLTGSAPLEGIEGKAVAENGDPGAALGEGAAAHAERADARMQSRREQPRLTATDSEARRRWWLFCPSVTFL